MNMDMPADPVKCLFVPKHEGLSQCVALGKTVAEAPQGEVLMFRGEAFGLSPASRSGGEGNARGIARKRS